MTYSNSIAVPHERATSSRRSRISEQATCIRPHTPGLPADWSHSLDKRRKESRPGAINMNLLDIDDFSMRSKVAQLMAVAPALPIVDLYHLIIDSEGNLPLAKKQAIRMSEAPQAQYRPDLDADGDEVMVKIDPNDPAFEWDDDEPAPEWATTIAPRQSRIKAKPNYKVTKAKSLRNNSKSTRSAKSATKYCSNTSAKRTQSTSMNPTHARETSSDRDFVVPDNTIHYDLGSDLSNDSDQSQDTIARSIRTDSDFEMLDGDDPLDLDIDMQPRFAYNTRLLRDGARS
jgi:hypothetical protein